MSQENVEIVRAAVDTFNRGGVDAAFEDFAPDFELDWSRAVGPLHGVFRSRFSRTIGSKRSPSRTGRSRSMR